MARIMACSRMIPSLLLPLEQRTTPCQQLMMGVINGGFGKGRPFSSSSSSSRINMSLRAGIVGLPNVGKSTLFNAVLRSEGKDYVVQEGDVMLFRFNV